MKKLTLLFVFMVLITSCKSTSAVDNYVNYEAQRNVKGTWMVTNVEYPNSNYIQINLLDIASSNCFKNSSWNYFYSAYPAFWNINWIYYWILRRGFT